MTELEEKRIVELEVRVRWLESIVEKWLGVRRVEGGDDLVL